VSLVFKNEDRWIIAYHRWTSILNYKAKILEGRIEFVARGFTSRAKSVDGSSVSLISQVRWNYENQLASSNWTLEFNGHAFLFEKDYRSRKVAKS
jgi:hypothetical protein